MSKINSMVGIVFIAIIMIFSFSPIQTEIHGQALNATLGSRSMLNFLDRFFGWIWGFLIIMVLSVGLFIVSRTR